MRLDRRKLGGGDGETSVLCNQQGGQRNGTYINMPFVLFVFCSHLSTAKIDKQYKYQYRAFTIICLNEEPHIPHQNLSNFWLHQQQLKGLIIKSQKLIIFLLTGWQPNGTLLSTNSISWIIFERTFYVLKCSSFLPTQIEKTAKATLTRKIYFRPNWVLWCKALAISSTTPMRTPTKSWPWTTKTKGTSISKTRNTDWPLLTTPKVLNWKSQVQTHWSKT